MPSAAARGLGPTPWPLKRAPTTWGGGSAEFALPQTRPMQWLHRGGAGSWTSHHSRAILEP